MSETKQVPDLVWVVAGWEPRTVERELLLPLTSPVERILALAESLGIESIEHVGQGFINGPVRTNGWVVMPAHMYQGIIPARAKVIEATLLNHGIELTGSLVAEDERKIKQDREIAQNFRPAAEKFALYHFDPRYIIITKEDYQWVSLLEWWT
jgi:hypothetical protein